MLSHQCYVFTLPDVVYSVFVCGIFPWSTDIYPQAQAPGFDRSECCQSTTPSQLQREVLTSFHRAATPLDGNLLRRTGTVRVLGAPRVAHATS